MKLLITLIAISIVLPAYADPAKDPFAGNTWRISILQDADRVESPACITFHTGGQLTMTDQTLTMLWKTHPRFSRIFIAVTHPTDRSVIPFHRGVHGYVSDDDTLRGSGLDDYGNAFQFVGKPSTACPNEPGKDPGQIVIAERSAQDEWTSASQKTVSYRQAVAKGLNTVDLSDLLVTVFTALSDVCDMSFCDPVLDPLGTSLAAVSLGETSPALAKYTRSKGDKFRPYIPTSRLMGRLFRFTVADGADNVRKHCWYFGPGRAIDTNDGANMIWVADDILTSASRGFRSVGSGLDGHGMAYQGALVGDDLLYVQGIEAGRGRVIATYGFGEAVESCEVTVDTF